MKMPHIRKSRQLLHFVNISLLSLCPVAAVAETGESAIQRTTLDSYGQIVLAGDAHATSMAANWELELKNNDGNQNQASMALCDGALYLCIDYFDADRNETLFLRRYDTSDGSNSTLSVKLPAYLQSGVSNFHSIFTDSNGTLCAAFLHRQTDDDNSDAAITLCKIIVDGDQVSLDLDNAVTIALPGIFFTQTSIPWMGNVIDFSGDLGDRTFDFHIMVGHNAKIQFSYNYYHIAFSASAEPQCSIETTSFAMPGDLSQNASPDIVPFPNEEDLYMVTRSPEYGAPDNRFCPAIYQKGEILNSEIMDGNDTENCRGIHTFSHNGHVLSVYAKHHNEQDGSVFELIEWDKTYSSFMPGWQIPASPFPFSAADNPAYYYLYRQVAITEPVDTSDGSNGDVTTNLYICSPGCGIGSYTLTTPTIITNLTSTSVNDLPLLSQRGNSLVVSNAACDADEPVKIFDMSAREICSMPANCSVIDLSLLNPGIYIARLRSASLKIHIR